MFAVVDDIKVKAWCQTNGKSFGNEVCEDKALKDEVYTDVVRLCKANKLNSLETPKNFMLILEPWTVESDILTPTMKLKRNVARKQYEADIKRVYDAGIYKVGS